MVRGKMKIIGITGGIGTGKSTVLEILKNDYGAFVIEADRVAEALMKKGNSAYADIVDRFGEDILDAEGEIDRKKLGEQVFNDKKKLEELNSITHGRVREEILSTIERVRASGEKSLVFIEAALLIECGYKDICDTMWYVMTKRDIRLKRLEEGRGIDRERAEAIMASQSDENFYLINTDVIILNDGDIDKLKLRLKYAVASCT